MCHFFIDMTKCAQKLGACALFYELRCCMLIATQQLESFVRFQQSNYFKVTFVCIRHHLYYPKRMFENRMLFVNNYFCWDVVDAFCITRAWNWSFRKYTLSAHVHNTHACTQQLLGLQGTTKCSIWNNWLSGAIYYAGSQYTVILHSLILWALSINFHHKDSGYEDNTFLLVMSLRWKDVRFQFTVCMKY